jgi:hypothetical protein
VVVGCDVVVVGRTDVDVVGRIVVVVVGFVEFVIFSVILAVRGRKRIFPISKS